MANKIHKTSIIDSKAEIGSNVTIGPYSIIEKDVFIGPNTEIGSNVVIKKYTTIGANNRIFHGAVLGEIPQDLKFNNEKSKLIIGNKNIIREYCTINRGTSASGQTIIGNDCLFMAYIHLAHDCILGDNIILANAVQVGGHVEIDSHAIIGGGTPIHQFCRVGESAFVGGGRVVLQDIPPYILATGEPLQFSGLNILGLRRRSFNKGKRDLIKKAYKLIYKSSFNISEAIENIKESFNDQQNEIFNIVNFIEKSNRGII